MVNQLGNFLNKIYLAYLNLVVLFISDWITN